jgi:tricorn protease
MTGSEESALRYADWVRRNREYVAEKSGGKFAYIHVPDMGSRGLREFDKWFYPQLDREGMVVDARWNGGGFVSQLMVSRLLRKLILWDRSRWGGVFTYPYRTLNGPFVVLTNEFAGSDGDIFPAAIQEAGAAPVIGKRSWGGVIGIRGDKPLVDAGMLTQPEYALYHPKRGWAIENHGVDPDIVVENEPQDVARGVDAQLDRAIQELMRLHAEKPPQKPEWKPAPDHSRDAYKSES